MHFTNCWWQRWLTCIQTWRQLDTAVIHSAAALPLKVGARLTLPRFHLLHLLGGHDDDRAKHSILPGLAGDVVKPFDYHSLHFIFWSFYSEKEHFDIHTHCACYDTVAELLPAAAAARRVGRAAAYSAEEYSCAEIRQTGRNAKPEFLEPWIL